MSPWKNPENWSHSCQATLQQPPRKKKKNRKKKRKKKEFWLMALSSAHTHRTAHPSAHTNIQARNRAAPRAPPRRGHPELPPTPQEDAFGVLLWGRWKTLGWSWMGLGATWANSSPPPGKTLPGSPGMGRGPGKSEAEGRRGKLAGI